VFDTRDRMVTREHVRHLLPAMQLSPDAERRLLGLHYPLPFTVVAEEFARLGFTPEVLVDRMGGSP